MVCHCEAKEWKLDRTIILAGLFFWTSAVAAFGEFGLAGLWYVGVWPLPDTFSALGMARTWTSAVPPSGKKI